MANAAMIEFIDVHKWYGAFHVLRAINLTVGRGERIVVCGPSGSGKSTLIRCVNRLEEHQRGVDSGRRHRTDRATCAPSTRCGAKSAWCSSRSTSSPI